MVKSIRQKKLVVGFAYNRIPEQVGSLEYNPEMGEWDSRETIDAVIKALESAGNTVIPLEAVRKKG